MDLIALGDLLEWNLFICCGLAGKLDFEVSPYGCRSCRLLGQMSTDRYHRKFAAPRHLKRVKIPVAVSGIKRFYRHCDQEIALSPVANTLALRRVAHSIYLMQGVRNMVSKGGLVERPLTVCLSKDREHKEYEANQDYCFL